MKPGECDRAPCPPVKIGDPVLVDLNPSREVALGVERVVGRIVAVTPYTHSLVVDDGNVVGGHGSDDVVRVRS